MWFNGPMRNPVNVNVINGRGLLRTAGRGFTGLISAGVVFVVLSNLALLAFYAFLIWAALTLAVTVVRRRRAARRPTVRVRMDDQAARDHRARMAALGYPVR